MFTEGYRKMKLNAVSGIMLTLLFIAMLTLAFNIQTVKAELGTIYIRADGSIDPPTAPISSVDNITYTFTGIITTDANGIVIEKDNILVDGTGYTLQGTGAHHLRGISLSGRSNVTIKNMKIRTFGYGIWLNMSSNNTISANNINSNEYDGIRLTYSSNNFIYGNNITNNGWCIMSWVSSNNIIYHNNFVNNTEQLYIYRSTNIWDDGYPSGGNYWSDYEDRYPDAEEIDESGIWNTPYVIDENNTDRYPLMNPWSTTYTLTITATYGGTTDPAPGTYTHVVGSTVQVTAKPRLYYLLDHWELDGSTEYSNPISVTMNSDHTLHAVFKHYVPPSVGGIYIPVNKLSLLAPYIGLTILLAVAVITVGYVKKRKKQTEINS